jgi:hypothetical protein
MLSRFEASTNDLFGLVHASDQFDGDMDLRIVDKPIRRAVEDALRKLYVSPAVRFSNDHMLKLKVHVGLRRQQLIVLQKNTGYSSAD